MFVTIILEVKKHFGPFRFFLLFWCFDSIFTFSTLNVWFCNLTHDALIPAVHLVCMIIKLEYTMTEQLLC